MRVDPARRTAVAEGGCTWADFDHETQAFGLAVTGGLVSTTGIAGFTLGGGIGWLMRKVGLTCDNLLAADVVTADGQLVHASEDENPELLWGLRGGGGNFGIATSLEFRLHPVGPMLLAGPIFFAGDRAEEVLRFYRDWVRELPDELTTLANLTTAPPAPFLPEAVHGKPIVAIVAVHAGEPEHGRALVAAAQGPRRPDRRPHRRHALHGDAEPARRAVDPRRAQLHALRLRRRAHRRGDRGDRRPAPGGALTALRDPLPPLRRRGGPRRRRRAAFGDRSAQFVLNVIARSPDADGFDANVAWARDTAQALAPVSRDGAYVNFMGDAGDERLRASYGDAKYERLVALKRRYDPTNLFRLNQNIAP